MRTALFAVGCIPLLGAAFVESAGGYLSALRRRSNIFSGPSAQAARNEITPASTALHVPPLFKPLAVRKSLGGPRVVNAVPPVTPVCGGHGLLNGVRVSEKRFLAHEH
jgi:hypothetical protein